MLFGPLADQACLDHIILDILSSNGKEELFNHPLRRCIFELFNNFHRYRLSSEEIAQDIGLLIGVGYTVKQIQEMIGLSESTIYRYMPIELKSVNVES